MSKTLKAGELVEIRFPKEGANYIVCFETLDEWKKYVSTTEACKLVKLSDVNTGLIIEVVNTGIPLMGQQARVLTTKGPYWMGLSSLSRKSE